MERNEDSYAKTDFSRMYNATQANGGTVSDTKETRVGVSNSQVHNKYTVLGNSRTERSVNEYFSKTLDTTTNNLTTYGGGNFWVENKTAQHSLNRAYRYSTDMASGTGYTVSFGRSTSGGRNKNQPAWSESTTTSGSETPTYYAWPNAPAVPGQAAGSPWLTLLSLPLAAAAGVDQDYLRVAGGAITFGFGAAAGPPGVVWMAVGLDDIITGATNLAYGRVGPGYSVFETAFFAATGSDTAARLGPVALALLFNPGSVLRIGGALGSNRLAGGFAAIPRTGTATAASPELVAQILAVAESPTFVANALRLGFTRQQLANIPARIAEYGSGVRSMLTGGRASDTQFLIGRYTVLGNREMIIRHELVHVLQDLKLGRVLFSMERTLGFGTIYNIERMAYLGQYGFSPLWRPVVNGLAAVNAANNVHPWATKVGLGTGILLYLNYMLRPRQ